jgi:adenylate cyclase
MAQSFQQFYRRCVRNMAIGTALSIVPAGAFYFFVFPYTARQLGVLAVLGALDLLIFFPVDMAVLKWTLRDVAKAMAVAGPKGPEKESAANAALKGRSSTEDRPSTGDRPSTEGRSSAERRSPSADRSRTFDTDDPQVRDALCEGMAALLDAPRRVIFPRIYGAHALAASAGITLLVMAANQWLGLGIPAHTFPLYWILNLTVVPVAHVVYEFAAMERTIQPVAAQLLSAGGGKGLACARPFTLEQRMRIFFPIFVIGPVAIIFLTVLIHAREHWGAMADAAHLLRDLGSIAAACIVLFLYLMYALGSQLRHQTGELVTALDQIGRGDFGARAELYSTDEFGQIAGHINTMATGLAERERLRDLFGAYMTNEVAAALLAKGDHSAERTEKRYVAILFLDVRGFTAFSNERPPEVVVGVLNKLLEQAVEAIAQHRGTVNKYLGDGLLAIFGAPIALENPSAAAVAAALEIAKRVRGLNHLFAATGVSAMKIGIGIHAGEVVVGSIGSPKHKLEYTVIGDAVNVASRIEQLNKPLGTELLVSDEVWSKCGSLQSVFGVALTEQVKGVDKPVKVYPLMADDRASAK